jgi:endo-1,4-beta-xylanase
MLIVGVSGVDSSMYCNDANRDFPVEDVLMRDLFPHIERGYGVGDGPEWRFLEGFSMGGYGAARLAMLYPDHFSAVSILSAAMHRPEFLRDERPDIFRRVFGGDLEYAKATSPWTITEERLREAAPLPRLRIVVGDADPLLDKNREYHRLLSEFGREHCFVEVPGVGHSSRDLYDRFPGNPLEFFRVLPNGG